MNEPMHNVLWMNAVAYFGGGWVSWDTLGISSCHHHDGSSEAVYRDQEHVHTTLNNEYFVLPSQNGLKIARFVT